MRAPLICNETGMLIKLPQTLAGVFGPDQTEVEVEQVGRTLVVSPARHPREGWAEAIANDPPNPKEALLLGDFPNEFDEKEWTW